MAVTAADLEVSGSDPRLRRARAAVLASLGTTLLTSLTMPGIGLLFERDMVWIVLGSVGILAVLSVPLVGPLGSSGDEQWETWAWLGVRSSARCRCWSGGGRRPLSWRRRSRS